MTIGPSGLPPRVGGKYRPIRHIATGGMGSVYEVEHEGTGEHLALKLLEEADRIPQGATNLTSGQDHTCFLLDGRVHCMGRPLFVGQKVPGQAYSCGGESACQAATLDPVKVVLE
jgi:serine/threonine protein kinase